MPTVAGAGLGSREGKGQGRDHATASRGPGGASRAMSSAGPAPSHPVPALRLCPPPGTPSPAPEALTQAAFPDPGGGGGGLSLANAGCLRWGPCLMSDASLPRSTATGGGVSGASDAGGGLSFPLCPPCQDLHTAFHGLDRVGRGACVGPLPLPGCLIGAPCLHRGPGGVASDPLLDSQCCSGRSY